MLTRIRVCLLVALTSGTSLFGADFAMRVTDKNYLDTQGFSVFLYDSTYHPVFVDQKNTAMEMIFHGQRIATNGDVRLMPTPEQWDLVATLKGRQADNGIVSGDPAMRTGLSNLAIAQWIPVAYNQAAPKDASGKPQIDKFLTDSDRKLFMDALMKQCDAKDGVADGMISDPLGCDFDPRVLACKPGQTDACIVPEKISAIKKAFAGLKNAYGTQVYPGFLYDAGITMKGVVSGLLALGSNGLFGPYTTATQLDVYKAALHASDPLVEPASTNLSTFSLSGGKLIFFHGDSDPWFSPLDTLGYYQSLAATNGGAEKVSEWSRMFLVPGMAHCGGGPALDHFDMLTAVVNWVEKGTPPDSVVATGTAFPNRGRPLCAYPKHAQYNGSGDSQDARNFRCQNSAH